MYHIVNDANAQTAKQIYDPDVVDAVIDDELEALENISEEEEEGIGADVSEKEGEQGGDTGLVPRTVSNEEQLQRWIL